MCSCAQPVRSPPLRSLRARPMSGVAGVIACFARCNITRISKCCSRRHCRPGIVAVTACSAPYDITGTAKCCRQHQATHRLRLA